MNRTMLAAALGTVVVATSGVARGDTLGLPEVVSAPTGNLLPGKVLYSRSTLGTDGVSGWDFRIGLGGGAESGLASSTLVERAVIDDTPERSPASKLQLPAGRGPAERVAFASASFRLGIAGDRLFPGQPGLVLGFRKSFTKDSDTHATTVASLHLAATRHFGRHAAVHIGLMMWDVGITSDSASPFYLHDRGLRDQVHGLAGIELRTYRDTLVLVDLTWEPELCPGCAGNQAELKPMLSWALRYELASWWHVQSGIRVSDVTAVDLIDVDLFAQLTFVSQSLRL